MSSTGWKRASPPDICALGGEGKWITIYARESHTFAVIAGLRLDTTPYDHFTGKWAPRWQTIYRPPNGFDARHLIGL